MLLLYFPVLSLSPLAFHCRQAMRLQAHHTETLGAGMLRVGAPMAARVEWGGQLCPPLPAHNHLPSWVGFLRLLVRLVVMSQGCPKLIILSLSTSTSAGVLDTLWGGGPKLLLVFPHSHRSTLWQPSGLEREPQTQSKC
jgi:hypothetical protein